MFGRRKKDEDPFAVLRDGATYESAPSSSADQLGLGAPSPIISAPLEPTVPPRAPTPKRRSMRSTGFGGATALRLAIFALVIAGIAVPLLIVKNAVHPISVPPFNFGQSSTPGASTPTPAPPRRVSYLRPAGVRAGLGRIAKLDPAARLALLRVDANSLSATATLSGGAIRQIYFGATVTSITAGASTGQRTIPIAEIHPSAVARLVVEMGRQFHVAPSRIDYMVISSPPGLPARWIVFSKAPSHPGFSASLSGANLTRLG